MAAPSAVETAQIDIPTKGRDALFGMIEPRCRHCAVFNPESKPWAGRIKDEYDKCFAMAVRSCWVSISDSEDADDAVEVMALTLHEAVALGLKAMRGDDWSGSVSEEYDAVQVLVTDISVEHTVKLKNFNAWLERSAGSPQRRDGP